MGTGKSNIVCICLIRLNLLQHHRYRGTHSTLRTFFASNISLYELQLYFILESHFNYTVIIIIITFFLSFMAGKSELTLL